MAATTDRGQGVSCIIMCVSAMWLAIGGVVLLFAPSEVLAMLVPGFPHEAAWIGQLLGAAWLSVAVLDWLQRRALLGGIHGRPVLLANFALYFIGAMSLVGAVRAGAPWLLWLLCAVMLLLAIAFGVLMRYGPFGLPSRGGDKHMP